MSCPARPIKDRFEEKFIPEPNSGCWLWEASCRPNGYGQFGVGRSNKMLRKVDYAHRVAWTLYCGEVPDGLHVLHKCDVRCCVNPDHMFIGTNADNMADKISKGRDRTAKPKLSDDDVRDIRKLKFGPTHIARMYGVAATTICAIQRGRKRTRVTGG
jgi:HNH endonuclease